MSSFLVSLFEHKAWCNARLAEALHAAQPHIEPLPWITILLTFEHTHLVDRAFRARLEDKEPDVNAVVGATMPDFHALVQRIAEMDEWYVRYVSRVTPAELDQIVEFTYLIDGQPGRMTKGDILGHVITHGASHRGAIGKMLENLRVKGVPDMMTTFRRPA